MSFDYSTYLPLYPIFAAIAEPSKHIPSYK